LIPICKTAKRISYDERSSLNINAYLWSYKSKEVIINDTISFKIIAAFAEKQFLDSKYGLSFSSGDSSQVKLVLSKDLVLETKSYGHTWGISDAYYHGNGLIRKYNESLPPDTIFFSVYQKDKIGEMIDENVIGSFFIIRDRNPSSP
jgi:hypothetical protein